MVEVTAQTSDGAGVTFEYEFGETLAAAIEIFGEDIVWSYAQRGLLIAAQGHARGMVKGGKSKDEILAAMAEWKPGAPRQTRSAEDRIRELMEKLSPEDRERLLKEHKAATKAKAA